MLASILKIGHMFVYREFRFDFRCKLKTSDIYTKNQLKLVMKTVTVRDKLHDKKK